MSRDKACGLELSPDHCTFLCVLYVLADSVSIRCYQSQAISSLNVKKNRSLFVKVILL